MQNVNTKEGQNVKIGHKLDGDRINCGDCRGQLFWIDGPTHYCICRNCGKISILNITVCEACKADVYCEPKFTLYRP